ncbi:putative FAD dependent oxidoreductase [Actinoplanes missouriensis 431]|uniref:Putative FAD dependent oxidoreductase n=1 Tax=Actinoplanes missouriensis (strain ATCC 14538 / DSM 43046 / CBS 188.64 / JCM 3121 / NBRC 102363 / NCIMB 12654 / NRRL B-3342 / UNCC 431) TaxID=512565 RepID=I0HDU3_ACTM4|nr:TIGR03364 family FAD-dependent oxidoreductase [Actinoplanes missouriensis]BAL91180.1 putative FAD dependent oxidoreductase [Actinoplanes missouriensis 431]
MRVIIVGGGVLGTMHAWQAVQRGHDVVQIEREAEARGASVRNFGLVWVSGRAPGAELETALRARELWERIGDQVPGIGFRGNGSLTLCRTPEEIAVAQAAADGPHAAARGFRIVDRAEARKINPALRGDFAAALWCERDGAVESRVALPALRAVLGATGAYRWVPGREARALTGTGVRDDHGTHHTGDLVVLTTGATLSGLVRELVPELPVRRVWLQMAQTAPLGEPLTTSVADADSFRYYPAFRGPQLDALVTGQPQPPVAATHAMQLLMVQRLDGGLTIGDTHAYAEPFPFDQVEEPYEHLITVASGLLGRDLPPIRRRWHGVYAQCTDPAAVVHRQRIAGNAVLVTGPGGRGMTCSPAIAEQTATEMSW